jgi:hypothetical protein
LSIHLHLSVSIDKGFHVDNVLGLSTATARTGRTRRAKSELDQVHGEQVGFTLFGISALLTHLNKRGTPEVLDRVSSNPGHIVVVLLVFFFKKTSLRHEAASCPGVDRDFGTRGHGISSSKKKGNEGDVLEHG